MLNTIKAATLEDLHTLSKECGVRVVLFNHGDFLDSAYRPELKEITLYCGVQRFPEFKRFDLQHIAVVVGLHELGHAYGYRRENDFAYTKYWRTEEDYKVIIKEERRAWKWARAHTHDALLPVFYQAFKLAMGSYVRDWIRSRPERREVERTLFWQGISTSATWTLPPLEKAQASSLVLKRGPFGTPQWVEGGEGRSTSSAHQALWGGGKVGVSSNEPRLVPDGCRRRASSVIFDDHDRRGSFCHTHSFLYSLRGVYSQSRVVTNFQPLCNQ